MNFGGGYGPSRGYGGPDINRLTTAPVLPDGWSKVGKGLWRHENGEESRVNPSALFTNSNFVESTRTHDDRIRERELAAGRQTSMESAAPRASSYDPRASSYDPRASSYDPRASYADSCRQASTDSAASRLSYRQPSTDAAVQPPGPPPGAPPGPPPDAPPAEPPGPPPGAPPPAEPAGGPREPLEWYYMDRENQRNGPVSCWGLSRLYDAGSVHDASYVWTASMGTEWQQLAQARRARNSAQFGAIPRTSL